jgi:hypothetical protein
MADFLVCFLKEMRHVWIAITNGESRHPSRIIRTSTEDVLS